MLIGPAPELVPRAVLGDGVNGIGGQVRLSQRSDKRPQHDGALALLDLVLWRLYERPRLHRNEGAVALYRLLIIHFVWVYVPVLQVLRQLVPAQVLHGVDRPCDFEDLALRPAFVLPVASPRPPQDLPRIHAAGVSLARMCYTAV